MLGPTASYIYWTSSSNGPVYAWYVNFHNGFVYGVSKDNDRHVRAVRGGS
jgi:hypothetical protein